MKNNKLLLIVLFFIASMSFESCGPIIVSSRPQEPMPGWFYPNRVVNVRYVYFPEYTIYYDITLRQYIYLENSVWITVTVLPIRFNTIDFRRAKQVRVNNYYGNSIKGYHSNRVNVKGRRTSPTRSTNSSTKPRTRRQ